MACRVSHLAGTSNLVANSHDYHHFLGRDAGEVSSFGVVPEGVLFRHAGSGHSFGGAFVENQLVQMGAVHAHFLFRERATLPPQHAFTRSGGSATGDDHPALQNSQCRQAARARDVGATSH